MSRDLFSTNVKSMCGGCFSVGRKLHVLNDESKRMFYKLLDISDNPEMLLCFECRATLQRVLQFTRQVRHVHTSVLSTIYSKRPQSLSKLNVSKMIQIDNLTTNNSKEHGHNLVLLTNYVSNSEISNNIVLNDDEIKHENDFDQTVGTETSNINYGNTSRIIENSYSYEHSGGSSETLEPMAFVKIEDTDFDGADCENNNELEHEIKVLDGNESDFCDSDNEPLKGKSQKVKEKKQHSKKKTGDLRPVPKGGRVSDEGGVVTDPRVARQLRALNVDGEHVALVLLTWDQVEEERRAALSSAALAACAHRCEHCAVGFNHRHKLLAHMRKHSEDAGTEVCDFCTIRCKTRAALCAHRRRHRARWVCRRCGWRCSRARVCADHCARAHAAPAPTHRCPHCAHTAPSMRLLRAHAHAHAARPACALCGKTFRDQSSLRTHALVHRGEKEHACSVCGKTFMFKKQKEIHEITHMAHQNLYCLKCDVTFKNQTSFYQHMKYNLKHIDPADIKHQCERCDKRFVRARRLEEHTLAVHLRLAPLSCGAPGCTFACASRAALRSHRRVVHCGRTARGHVCPRCGLTYKSKKSLEGHLRSHSNARREQTSQVQAAPT